MREANVPLSEEEQRLLHEMEQALVAEDPKFASALRGSTLQARSRRQALLSAVAFVLGIAGLMFGAVFTNTPLAVAGFLVMLAAAYAFVVLWRRAQTSAASPETARSTPRRAAVRERGSSGSFMERMEERWRRRRDDGA